MIQERFILLNQIRKYKIKNCVDIGAHVGEFSKKLLENRDINVIAFEPMKKSYADLKKMEKICQNQFKCFNVALSNKVGTTKIFYTNPSSQLSSIAINLNKINFLKNKKIKREKLSKQIL